MRNFRKEAKAFWVVIGLIVLANIETSQFIQLSGNNYSLRRLRAEVFSYVTQVRDLLAGSCQSVEGEFFEAGYKVQFKGNFYPQDSDHPLLKDKGKAFFWMRISKDGEGVGYIVLYPGKDSYQIETAVCTSYNWQGNALAIKNLLLGVTPLKIEEKRFHPETYKQLESRLSGIIYYQELNRIKNDWPVYLKEYFLGKIREVLEKQSLLEEIPEGLAYLDKIQSYKEEFEQETELKELQNLGREFMDLTADFLRRSSQLKDYLPQFLDLRYEMLGKPEFFSYIKVIEEIKKIQEEEVNPGNIETLLANLGEQTRYFGTYYKIWQAYNKMGEDFDLVKKYRKFLEENPGKPLLAFIRLMEWINDTLKKEDLPKDLAEVKDLAEKPVNIDHLLTNLGEQTMYFSTYYTIWQAYKGIIDERFSELLRQTHNNAYEAFNLFWKELIENAPNAEIKALVEVGTSVSELLRNLGFSVGLEIYAYVDREGRLVISNNFNQLILEKVDLDGIDGLLSQIEGEVARLQREGRLSLENRVIEYKSVEIAKYFEQQREVKLEDIQDMSDPTEKNGFDLKTKLGEEERYIEVKGRSFDGLNRIIITLTPNQINVASEEEKKDKYYLYIVIWIDNKPFLYIIKDPYKLFEQILDEG